MAEIMWRFPIKFAMLLQMKYKKFMPKHFTAVVSLGGSIVSYDLSKEVLPHVDTPNHTNVCVCVCVYLPSSEQCVCMYV